MKEKLYDAQLRFAGLVWDNEPIGSGELVRLSLDALGWKKSTTYTVLKRLCEKGILKNEGSVVTSIVKREQVQARESEEITQRVFDGSLPSFIAAFLDGKKLSKSDADELQRLIDAHREG